jgi:hypothetical protein
MMLLQSIIDCGALVEPLWISVMARLIGRERKQQQ